MRGLTRIAILMAALWLEPGQAQACTNILVTKGASKTGSTMISYSADSHLLYGELYHAPATEWPAGSLLDIYEWDSGKFLGRITQPARTYSTIGNMNEYQLCIAETTFGGRQELVDTTGIMDYGSLMYVTLQRARTAREAVEIMTTLVAEYGYCSGGESFSIADPEEVWILEMIGKGTETDPVGYNRNKGAVWVAVKLPDGTISAHANQARISQFPLNDPENCIYSPDVITFARERGYFSGRDEDFRFCDVYAPLDFGAMRYCEARVWAVFNRFEEGMEQYIDYAMGYNPGNPMPLWIEPSTKLTVTDVADMMRDHYEDTPMDMRNDIGAGGHNLPYRWRPMEFELNGETYLNERAVATQQTGFWFVSESRNWLPETVGGILWFGVDDAGTSCLTPVYSTSNRVPKCFAVGNGHLLEYSPTSAFWLFNRVANFAYLRYDLIQADIIATADEFMRTSVAEVLEVDRYATELLVTDAAAARDFLTGYSEKRAQQLFDTWDRLDKYLLVKYMDGNVKRETSPGVFEETGMGPGRAPYPLWPGYNQKWKEAVVRDNGETLRIPEQ